jgi:hypothetical protein
MIFICNNIIDNYGMGNEQGKEPYYLEANKANPMKASTNKNTFQDYEKEHQYNEGVSVAGTTATVNSARAARAAFAAIMIFMILLLVILLANLLLKSRKKRIYK